MTVEELVATIHRSLPLSLWETVGVRASPGEGRGEGPSTCDRNSQTRSKSDWPANRRLTRLENSLMHYRITRQFPPA